MGNASTSAAQLGEAASIDPLTGFEAANDAYGSLAMLATRPKPKKKPVLVLDADELAAAHLLFQQGANEQLEDADQITRGPVMLGLAPLGSDAETDNYADADMDIDMDEAEYAIEADAPAPEEVLNITRADGPSLDAPQKTFRKAMVALPPDGDPALDDIEPFVPLAPTDDASEEYEWAEELGEGFGEESRPEYVAEPGSESGTREDHLAAFDEYPQPASSEALAEDLPAYEALDDEEPAFAPGDVEESKPELVPEPEPEHLEASSQVTPFEAEPGSKSNAPVDTSPFTHLGEEEAIDGYAFMRAAEPRKLEIASAGTQNQNSLRARLIREEDLEIVEPDPSLWTRIAEWFTRVWQRFLG